MSDQTKRYVAQIERDDEPIYVVDTETPDPEDFDDFLLVVTVERVGDPGRETVLARKIVDLLNSGVC